MTTVLSPVASTSRRPSLTKSDAKSPVKETDNYDPDVEEWQDDMEVEDDESDGESDADLEQVVYGQYDFALSIRKEGARADRE